MGRLREEDMVGSVGMREGDQRWLALWWLGKERPREK
jgi:hypothetical protein